MQRAVTEGWADLDRPILAHLAGARAIKWLSPLLEDGFAEYRDAAFLRHIGLDTLVPELAKFWPMRGPQWDGLARSDAGHVILAEAKAHIGEFCSPPSQASPKSLAIIHDALVATAIRLGVGTDHLFDWGRHFYQYANRLAHLQWLRDRGVDAKLVLIGFINDDEMPGRTTKEAWEAAYLVANNVLGLRANHSLSRHVIHVYPNTMRC